MSATTRLWQKRFSTVGGVLWGMFKGIFSNPFTRHPVFKVFAIPVGILIFINVGVKVGFIEVAESTTSAVQNEKPKTTVDYIRDLNDDAWRKAKRSRDLVPAETILRMSTLFDEEKSMCFRDYMMRAQDLNQPMVAGEFHSQVNSCVRGLDVEHEARKEVTDKLQQREMINKLLKETK